MVSRSLWLICCAPFKKRGQTRACQSASETWQPDALLSPCLRPAFTTYTPFSSLQRSNSFLRYTGTTSPRAWVFLLSREYQSAHIYIQWTVRCQHACTQICTFQSFSGNHLSSFLLFFTTMSLRCFKWTFFTWEFTEVCFNVEYTTTLIHRILQQHETREHFYPLQLEHTVPSHHLSIWQRCTLHFKFTLPSQPHCSCCGTSGCRRLTLFYFYLFLFSSSVNLGMMKNQ